MRIQNLIFIIAAVVGFALSANVQPLFAQGPATHAPQDKPVAASHDQPNSEFAISLTEETGAVVVKAGDQPFTRYDYSTYAKPILYPVYGPNQLPMTRNTPMKPTPGEANDHPHHKSMWLGHIINGVDFWSESGGSVKHDSLRIDAGKNQFVATSNWIRNDGIPVCSDESTYQFGAAAGLRWIDVTIIFRADHGLVEFEDTKEGTFAIRTNPNLRLSPDEKLGVEKVTGHALNSNGTTGAAIWGESANWVYYWGEINDETVGIAIFDHPSNLRHPTTWHAREYGLIAANPFGWHYFKNEPKGAGAFVLNSGQTLALRYRVAFQLGQQTADDLNTQFEMFSKK